MTRISRKYFWCTLVILSLPVCMNAQQADEDNSFGGWHFVEVDHKFGDSKWIGMLYFEHENIQYQRLDCWFIRPGVHYNVLPWLKLGVSYDYLKVPSTYGLTNFMQMEGLYMFTFRSIDLKHILGLGLNFTI